MEGYYVDMVFWKSFKWDELSAEWKQQKRFVKPGKQNDAICSNVNVTKRKLIKFRSWQQQPIITK
jgi:hypothetical protein